MNVRRNGRPPVAEVIAPTMIRYEWSAASLVVGAIVATRLEAL